MPPVIAFAGGSLGFLTPFAISDWLKVLMPLLQKKCEAGHQKLGSLLYGVAKECESHIDGRFAEGFK